MERELRSVRSVALARQSSATFFCGVFLIAITWSLSRPFANCLCEPEPETGFISIDCGAERTRIDPATRFVWLTENDCLDSNSELQRLNVAVPAHVELGESKTGALSFPEEQKSAMLFIPNNDVTLPSKYCYALHGLRVNSTSNYLLRVVFPSRRLTPKSSQLKNATAGQSTRFYFTVDSTFISTIELKSNQSQTIELVVVPLDDSMYVCLVPLEDRSAMPAISSIELRRLSPAQYLDGRDASRKSSVRDTGSTSDSSDRSNTGLRTTYLMTVARLDFGGNPSEPAVRYPRDKYDRAWESPTPPSASVVSVSLNETTLTYDFLANYDYPLSVAQTAWEGVDMTSNITIAFNTGIARAARPIPSYYLAFYFRDVERGANGDTGEVRAVNIFLHDDGGELEWASDVRIYSNQSYYWWNYHQTVKDEEPVFVVSPSATSTRPTLINGFEVFGEFEAQTERTVPNDALTITNFSGNFREDIDTVGDPCLPVPWNWLVCSIETPPRITQINISSKGFQGEIPERFGSLNRLTTFDLSNNSFHGNLPPSLAEVETLTELNVAFNQLSGVLPSFKNQSLQNIQTISLRNNKFTGSLLPLFMALRGSSSIRFIDVSRNGFNDSVTGSINTGWARLEVLDVSTNNLTGILPVDLVRIPKLRTLNFEGNKLTGEVPSEVWSPDSTLEVINLRDNEFEALNLTLWCRTILRTGDLSAFRQKVNLVNNKIQNVVLPPERQDCLERLPRPEDPALFLHGITGFVLMEKNPWCERTGENIFAQRYLCRSSEFQDFWSDNSSGVDRRAIIISVITSCVILVLMACILAFVLRRMWKRMKELRHIQEALAREDVRPPFFKYEELKTATSDFSSENELGRGGYGAVYKGVLTDKSTVAVKLLFATAQNMEDFLKEMVLVTGIKHRHLVQLKGCCVRDHKRILVYEFAENKSVADALWGEDRSGSLTWSQRLRICIGVARGLCYLHEELQPKIIHRDIKAQNILLDKDFGPKIADFGLARQTVQGDKTQLATRIGGTLGYFSPEYATHGKLTEKLDVYSFGILVLEIVSGRRCIDNSRVDNPDETYLKDWAFHLYKNGKLRNLAEKDLSRPDNLDQVELVLKVALACLNENYENRPSMSKVVNMLSGSSTEEVAVDIVGQLREQELLYESLFNGAYDENGEREHSTLLQPSFLLSGSSSDAQQLLKMNVTKPR